MHLRVLRSELLTIPLRTRLPFRYGIATMTDVPEAFLRIWLELDGKEAQGIASDCLPPKWFTKVPEKPLDEEVREMLEVIAHAQEIAAGLAGTTVFGLWRALYDAQPSWGAERGFPPLLGNFGVSLIERAAIDAVCRSRGGTFFDLLKAGEFGIGDVRLSQSLPARPLDRVTVRHTVGLADPLTEEQIPASERLQDGLPQSLEAAIRRYGLRHFKIKVSGKVPHDLERLSEIARVIRENAGPGFKFSLDGNEQFGSLDEFREFWREAEARPELREFSEALLFVEQPLHRADALNPELKDEFSRWPERPPIIIDESDGAVGDVATALELGYAGASHKNCKGVMKGLANFALISSRQAAGQKLIMTGEDLCNVGPVALQQDLAVMAALGISSVERNGHHYHAGLSQFPRAAQERALAGHSDHYERSAPGWPTLRIVDGELSMGTINAAPFGSAFSAADWSCLSEA